MRSPIEINVNIKNGECWTLKVNGLLVFQGVGRGGETRDELEIRMTNYAQESQLVTMCRAAVVGASDVVGVGDHIEKTRDKKRVAYAMGLLDGLTGEPRRPEDTISHRQGYGWGETIMHIAGFRSRDELAKLIRDEEATA